MMIDLEDCLIWAGWVNATGYGMVRQEFGHRLMYEKFVGPIPQGMFIDHLCRVRQCVNPDHLEVVTHQENTRRGEAGKKTGALNKAKTECPYGHKYTKENTYVYLKRPNQRQCRECMRRRNQEMRVKRKKGVI